METNLKKNTWGSVGNYETPSLEVIDLQIEGSVCVFDSQNFTEGIGRGDYDEI